jgi:ribosome-binding protein aMBF1 (putative translation factor)
LESLPFHAAAAVASRACRSSKKGGRRPLLELATLAFCHILCQKIATNEPTKVEKRVSKRRVPKAVAKRGRRLSFKKATKRLFVARRMPLKPDGLVAIDEATATFQMSRAKLAETVGVAPATLQRSARASAQKTQTRLREMIEIVKRVSGWAGGPMQAMAWYRAEPLPEFGGRTAESLVKAGKAAAVRDYLDGVALGNFA